MPRVTANNITLSYDQQGSGEPLILLPHLAADHTCFAFQVPEYAKHFTCISVDLRGTGESDKPDTAYTTEHVADDVAALMQALGLQQAHVAGLSFGAGVGLWLAAKYPDKVQSLSLHGGWHKTDLFLKTVIESWQLTAKSLGSVSETVIRAIFPWCLTPELYSARPDYIQSLADFVRSRPAQSVQDFIRQANAVLTHDAGPQLGRIKSPTLLTTGRYDMLTSIRFATSMQQAIRSSEVLIFEGCSHAPFYENVEEFNHRTLEFLRRGAQAQAA